MKSEYIFWAEVYEYPLNAASAARHIGYFLLGVGVKDG